MFPPSQPSSPRCAGTRATARARSGCRSAPPARIRSRVGRTSASSVTTAIGAIEDYTFLWYDVRPHPRLGTIEIRAMDSQTRIEHTIALSAFIVSLVKLLVEQAHEGVPAPDPAWEILDENRWLAARHGLGAELVDEPSATRVGVRELTASLLEQLAPHAGELGCASELEGINDLLRAGNGALRQQMVYEANHDLRELVSEIVARTA